jgi:serine/threonine-protein kinase
MSKRYCTKCGAENEVTGRFCRACGNALEEITVIEQPQQPKSDFGFSPTEIDFAIQGVGVGAATRLNERFQPVLHINSGGMGKLFLVQELLSGRYVALKVMLEDKLKDTSLVHQFVREAVITARLQHPHIIPVHELGFLEKGQLYYSMRYVDGHPLSEIMYDVELEEKLRILRSAALAVDFAHSQGLWHRDLKPQNILVGLLGDAYVIDWGLVTVQHAKEYRLDLPRIVVGRDTYILPDRLLENTNAAITTAGGQLIGTPAYMAPEQFEADDAQMGVVSDIWAFGIMLFEALTQRHPVENHRTLSFAELARQMRSGRFPEPRDIVKDLPQELSSLCLRMLKPNVKDRMKSLKEFHEEVTQYLKKQGQTIWGFGTFQGKPRKPEPLQAEDDTFYKEVQTAMQNRINDLQKENNSLRMENARQIRKIELLTEIAQLGVLNNKRKNELWRELVRL